MKKKKDETEVEKDDPHRQVAPVVEGKAVEIFDWLEEIFQIAPKDTAPGEPKTDLDAMPERIALHPVYKQGQDRAPALCNKEWRPTASPLPTREMLVKLANEFLSKAQRDCSTHGVRKKYCLYAFSNLKGADAYQTFSFTLMPGGKEHEKDQGIEDESELIKFVKQTSAHTQFAIDKMSEMLSSVTSLQNQMMLQVMTSNKEIIAENRQLTQENLKMMQAVEDAKLKRQQEEWKAMMWQLGFKIATPLIQAGTEKIQSMLPAKPAQAPPVSDVVVDMQKLIADIGVDQRVQIFGLIEDGAQKQAGILELEQTLLLDGILKGEVEPARLREFVESLTDEQKMKMAMTLKPEQLAKLLAIAEAAGIQ